MRNNYLKFFHIINKNNQNDFSIKSVVFHVWVKNKWKREAIVKNFFIQSTKVSIQWI
jgi:hypothetical protein